MDAKPVLGALILGAAAALFIFRDWAAARFPKSDGAPDKLGTWQVQATITLLAVIGLALLLSD